MSFEVTFNKEQETNFMNYVKQLILDQYEQVQKEQETARPILTKKATAAWLGVSTATIDTWKAAGLKVSLINNRPYFLKSDVLEFIENHKV